MVLDRKKTGKFGVFSVSAVIYFMTEVKVAFGAFTIVNEETESPQGISVSFCPESKHHGFDSVNSNEGCLVTHFPCPFVGGRFGRSLMCLS